MSNHNGRAVSGRATRPGPFLMVKAVRTLAKFAWHPDAELDATVGPGGVVGVAQWLCARIQELTGIPRSDIWRAFHRLAESRPLDGHTGPGVHPDCCGDLSHVGKALHDLDNDGSAATLWDDLCQLWPLFADLFQTASGPGQRPRGEEDTSLPWNGPDWYKLQPLPRNLLAFMHGRRSASVEELQRHVWRDEVKGISGNPLNMAIHRANEFLRKREHHELLAHVRGENLVRWQIAT